MKKNLFYLLFLFTFLCNAQNPGDVAQTFDSTAGFNKSVQCTLIQSDGKIVVGGQFTSYHSSPSNGICRLNADGTVDTSFNVGAGFSSGATVYSLALQSDGKIIVGGYFTTYKGVAANSIIRLNTDGSIDSTFNYGTGFSGAVYVIKIQSDGKILAGGNFTSYQGATQNRLIRLNADGSKDTAFNIGTGFNSYIKTIAIQTDGKIIAGGNFTTLNGATSPKSIIRLNSNGTVDTTFITSGGFDEVISSTSYTGTVNAIELQADGKIIVGGIFDIYTANSTSVSGKRIIRLNADGTKDTSFDVASGFLKTSTTAGIVNSISMQSDGKIIVGGDFQLYYTTLTTAKNIIRLNTDGAKDTSFAFANGFNDIAYCVTVLSNGKILAGGNFTTYEYGSKCGKIALINANGSFDATFYKGNGINGNVFATTVQQDNKIIAVGDFNAFQNNTQNRIVRFNTDGTKDTSFSIGTGFNNVVESINLQADGKIIVGGQFSSYNGSTAKSIIRLNTDGTIDTSFVTGTGFNSSVKKIIIQPNGKIIVIGSFSTYNGATSKYIARLNADGTIDASFNPGATSFNFLSICTAALQSDGKIIVGGNFTQFNGNTENRLIRLNADGTKDTSFTTGSGFDATVRAIVIQSNGKIIVGGEFTSYNGATGKNYIIGLNSDGSVDTSFAAGTGFNSYVNALYLQGDGKIVVGGSFNTYNGVTNKQIIRLNNDGTKDSTFSTAAGFGDAAFPSADNLTVTPNGKIIVGGYFDTYQNTNYSTSLIALHGGVALATNDFEVSNSVKIYPNPAKDILNITTIDNSEIVSAKIYDLQGKLVLETTTTSIDTNNLTSGLYFVNIVTEKGQSTKKFIKE